MKGDCKKCTECGNIHRDDKRPFCSDCKKCHGIPPPPPTRQYLIMLCTYIYIYILVYIPHLYRCVRLNILSFFSSS